MGNDGVRYGPGHEVDARRAAVGRRRRGGRGVSGEAEGGAEGAVGGGALGPEADAAQVEEGAELLGDAPVGVGDQNGAADAGRAGQREGGEQRRLYGDEDVEAAEPAAQVRARRDGEGGELAGRRPLVEGVGRVGAVGQDPGLDGSVERGVEYADLDARRDVPTERRGC